MRGRLIAVWAALVVGSSVASGQGLEEPYPKLRDGVRYPPIEAVTGAPFDVARLFEVVPPDENAAPLYLDALFEFSAETGSCFPDSPERTIRLKIAHDRNKRRSDILIAWEKDPKSVPDATLDAMLGEYREGFRKLAEAQKRERCVFETGLGITALLPHVQSARTIANVVKVKIRRELDNGDIDAAIDDVKMVLRLNRDIQRRGYAITQLVYASVLQVVGRNMVLPILETRGLRPDHCDKLLAVLVDHEAKAIDAFSEALEVEYVSGRVTLLDLIKRQADYRASLGLNAGESVIKKVLNLSGASPQKAPDGKAAADAKDPIPDDADAQFARITQADLNRMVERLNAYVAAQLALKNEPREVQSAKMPDTDKYLGGDDLLSRMTREIQMGFTSRLPNALGRADAVLRASECLTAVRCWQLNHGGVSPPAGDLLAVCTASGLLPAVPADPFTGKPMRLAKIDGDPAIPIPGGKADPAMRLLPPHVGR